MKFVLTGAGLALGIFLLTLKKISFLGSTCYVIGNSHGDGSWGSISQPVCLHPAIYFIGLAVAAGFCLVGIYMFAQDANGKSSSRPSYGSGVSSAAPPSTRSYREELAVKATPTSVTDSQKWKTLREFDGDIQNAMKKIEKFGLPAEERLATAYLAVSDKQLLDSIVTKIIADEEQQAAKWEEQKTKRHTSLSENAKQMISDRESRAIKTIAEIKAAGMMYNGKNVVSVEMYNGEAVHDQGWAMIQYEDGSKELRAGTSFTAI
jgi:hypothetical protein